MNSLQKHIHTLSLSSFSMEETHSDDCYYTPTLAEEAEEQTAVEIFLHEFFAAPHMPASNHEEWLLRLCAQMMHREAEIRASTAMTHVSMRGKGGPQRRRRQAAWNNNGATYSGASEASTKQSMETDIESWSES